ncbi:MAG: TonB family protein [Comamonadaceae bacterium]|nr:MAG: TonB family protein [Comamonadaceae bacterium]
MNPDGRRGDPRNRLLNPMFSVQRAVLACAMICSLCACTMPRKAPTEADLAGQPGGRAAPPSHSAPPPERIDPHPPALPKAESRAAARPAVVTPARVLVRPAPAYPASLGADGTEGRVMVRYTVDASGRARDLQIVQASHPLFAEEVRAAMARWRFEPARDASGNAVEAPGQQSFRFRQED